MKDYLEILRDGLWTRNAGFVQLLGLCPLLAVSTTVINGIGLGLATMAVLVGSNLCISAVRHWIRPEIRIPVFVTVIASLVTSVELVMNAWFHGLYRVLGIFIPLIVTNCTILGRAEAFASRNGPVRAAVDGLATGAGFALVLVLLGGLRELVARGTLLADAGLLFGSAAQGIAIRVPGDYPGLLFAALPPGAFVGLGLLIALRNVIDERLSRRRPATASARHPGELPEPS